MGSMECKLLIRDLATERHPDVAIYLSPPPDPNSSDFWLKWIPEIVIEIVSPSSRKRDYEEKPDEYLALGVREYWILDALKRQMVVLRRSRDRWIEKTIRPPALHRTRRLPGVEFSCEAVFAGAGLT
jgi:Uma2 family endonuclease